MPRSQGLTPEQQRFVDEYLIDLNGTQAYRRAFPGASYHTSRNEAAKLLAKPCIKREVKAARDAQQRRTRITADRVLRELARIAFADVADVMDLTDPDRPRLKPLRDMPPDARRAVQEISRTPNGVKVKLAAKQAALDRLCQHLGLSTQITPLEALLATVPAEHREFVRTLLAGALPPGDDPPGTGGRPAVPR